MAMIWFRLNISRLSHPIVISHLCALGAIKKKFSISMLSSVVVVASLADEHLLRNMNIANCSSSIARWSPMQADMDQSPFIPSRRKGLTA